MYQNIFFLIIKGHNNMDDITMIFLIICNVITYYIINYYEHAAFVE